MNSLVPDVGEPVPKMDELNNSSAAYEWRWQEKVPILKSNIQVCNCPGRKYAEFTFPHHPNLRGKALNCPLNLNIHIIQNSSDILLSWKWPIL